MRRYDPGVTFSASARCAIASAVLHGWTKKAGAPESGWYYEEKEKDVSSLSRGLENAPYTHTNPTHDTHTLQFLLVLFRHHILVDLV